MRPISKMLVTGGLGFIGSNFIGMIQRSREQYELVNIDAETYAATPSKILRNGSHHYDYVKGNICDRDLMWNLIKGFKPDVIVHFAAETHVDRSVRRAEDFIQTNINGVQTIIEVMRGCDSKALLVYVSTDEVYGSLAAHECPSYDNDIPLPNNPYSVSKLCAELLLRAAHRASGLQYVITRCTNNYGPGQNREKLIPLLVEKAVKGEPLPLYGDGLHIRDWIHVDDHCSALLAVAERGEPQTVWNVGASNERTNMDVAKDILRITGSSSEIKLVADRPGHDRRYAINASTIRNQLGWKPERTTGESFEETIKWYMQETMARRRESEPTASSSASATKTS